jgi:hypothetical protein
MHELGGDPSMIIVNIDKTAILTAFIGTIPSLIVSLGGLILILKQVGIIHAATNSMKDALVTSTAKASRAEGVIQGKLEEQARIVVSTPQPPVGFKATMRSIFINPW